MQIGRVIGKVWATRKDPNLESNGWPEGASPR